MGGETDISEITSWWQNKCVLKVYTVIYRIMITVKKIYLIQKNPVNLGNFQDFFFIHF